MTSDLVSRPYQPNPEKCCEACAFGAQKHATWCCQGTLDKCPQPPHCMACLMGRTDHAEWCNAPQSEG
jgi:hypothetical protein